MSGAHGLGELEAEIMTVMWDNEHPATVRDVLAALERDAAYTTVMTVMDNLHRKGLLTRERFGKAFHYRPVWSREESTARLMRDVFAPSDSHEAVLPAFRPQQPAEEARSLLPVCRRHTRHGT